MNTTGNYTTNQGDLTIDQTGENVNGKYSKTGVLEGSISGNIITGIWKNSGKEGLFEFVFSDDLSFKGKYKIGFEQGALRSKWDGQITNLNNTEASKDITKPVEIISPDFDDDEIKFDVGALIKDRGTSTVKEIYRNSFTQLKKGSNLYDMSNPAIIGLLDSCLKSCLSFYEWQTTKKKLEKMEEEEKIADIKAGKYDKKKITDAEKIKYDNGLYIGDIDPLTRSRHGYGAYIWNQGDYYEGNWVQGERTGKGIFIWQNGKYYVGDFIDGKRTGIGREWDKDEFSYATGKFVDGKPEKPYVKSYDYVKKNLSSDLADFFKTQARGLDYLKEIFSNILQELPKNNLDNSNNILKNISCDFIWYISVYNKKLNDNFGSDHKESIEQTQCGVKISLESIFSNTAPKMINEITQTDFNNAIYGDIMSQIKPLIDIFEERLQIAIESKNNLPYIKFEKGNNTELYSELLKIKGYHPIFVNIFDVLSINYEQSREDIRVIFMGLGLIEQSIKKRSVHDKETYWKLTEKGNKMMVDIKMKKLM